MEQEKMLEKYSNTNDVVMVYNKHYTCTYVVMCCAMHHTPVGQRTGYRDITHIKLSDSWLAHARHKNHSI